MIADAPVEDPVDARFTVIGAALPQGAAAKLSAYLVLLAKWNRVYNLTAIREPEKMATHHVADALSVLPHLPQQAGLRLLDVGSGGGVPGLPLAIARPDWHVTVLDSNQKKGAFLRQAAIELALTNVEAVTARIEEYSPTARFDVIISRAFAELSQFVEASLPRLAPGGRIAAMKGVYPHDEIAGLQRGARVVDTVRLTVPGVDAERHLVLLEAA